VLEDHGVPYVQKSIKETWAQDKMDYEKYPFNQGALFAMDLDAGTLIPLSLIAVPVFNVNGEVVAQQDAILRCVAPSIPWRTRVLCMPACPDTSPRCSA
jgi:hypothetical protein